MRLKIVRKWATEKYIIGRLYVENELICNTLELPWKDNAPNVSCVPPGIYALLPTYSAAFKRVLPLVLNVPGRAGIRIHRGNGPKDTQGCILVGENTQKGKVLNSRKYEEYLVKKISEAKARGELVALQVVSDC